MKKLNIGCGKDIRKSFINMDIKNLPGVDIIQDIEKRPWPFKNNEFDYILAKDVLEHVTNLPDILLEIRRIMKPGSILEIIVPHFTSSMAFIDPTHKHFFGFNTFDYFCKENKYSYYFDKMNFKIIDKRIIFGKKYALWNYIIELIANKFPVIYENTPLRIFPAETMWVIMQKNNIKIFKDNEIEWINNKTERLKKND